MATALSALKSRASEKYPSYELDLEDGSGPVLLKSIMVLDEDELLSFSEGQKTLNELDDSEDLENLPAEFATLLASVSSDPERTLSVLSRQSIGVLTILFEDYAGALSEGAKSESDS